MQRGVPLTAKASLLFLNQPDVAAHLLQGFNTGHLNSEKILEIVFKVYLCANKAK